MLGAETVTGAVDTVLIYRELSYLRLGELEHLGQGARDAYQQMKATEQFTPHTRIDVAFRAYLSEKNLSSQTTP